MLIALCFTSDFDFAGQTSTHTPQPVQSSGATWIVIAIPDTSFDRNALDLNPSGAPASSVGSYTFIRIVVCGHTAAHRPQSMQMSGSKIGISWAIERFSYLAVPVGKTPSTGKRRHGQQVTVAGEQLRGDPLHELGRPVGDGARAGQSLSRSREPRRDEGRRATRRSRRSFARRSRAARCVRLLERRLDVADRLLGGQNARQSEEARLHHRVHPVAHLRLAGDALARR